NAASGHHGTLRLHFIDAYGNAAGGENYPTSDWRGLRNGALRAYDRNLNVFVDWCVRVPAAWGDASETAPSVVLAEPSNSGDFAVTSAQGQQYWTIVTKS